MLSNSEYDLTGGGINAYFYFCFDNNLYPLLCPTKTYPAATPHRQVRRKTGSVFRKEQKENEH